MIFEWCWESGEVPADWKLGNIVLIFKKGKEEDPGKHRLSVSLQRWVQLWRRLFWEVLKNTWRSTQGISLNQHGFRRGKSCLSNLISFYNRVTHLAGQGQPVDVIFLDFSKAFGITSHRILVDKLSSPQLGN